MIQYANVRYLGVQIPRNLIYSRLQKAKCCSVFPGRFCLFNVSTKMHLSTEEQSD